MSFQKLQDEYYEARAEENSAEAWFGTSILTGGCIVVGSFLFHLTREIEYGNLNEDVVLYRAVHKDIRPSAPRQFTFGAFKFNIPGEFIERRPYSKIVYPEAMLKMTDMNGQKRERIFNEFTKFSNDLEFVEGDCSGIKDYENLKDNFVVRVARIPRGQFVKIISNGDLKLREISIHNGQYFEGQLAYTARRMKSSWAIRASLFFTALTAANYFYKKRNVQQLAVPYNICHALAEKTDNLEREIRLSKK
jgi:hypothetical protein